MLELRDLRRFLVLAEERHFGRAAARLGMGQPQLSRALQKLERLVGTRLLDRTSRDASLTEAGTALLRQARDILDRAAEAPALARRAAVGEVGSLALGFSGSCAYAFLSVAVEGYRRTHPNVELTLREMAAERQVEQLREGRLDLCLMRGTGVPPGLSGALVFEEALVVALPRANPLSARTQVAPADLAPHPFVTFPRDAGNGYHRLVTEICAAAGFTPKLAQEVSPMHALIGLVAAGVGVAIVPASVRKLHFSGVVYRKLAAVETRSQVWAVWRQDRLPAPARAFATGIGAIAA